jgi:hypothetical protein
MPAVPMSRLPGCRNMWFYASGVAPTPRQRRCCKRRFRKAARRLARRACNAE